MKTLNEKELQLKVLVDLECIYIGIDEQLVKKVTSFALLKLETNRHMENIDIVVTNLNGIDMLLWYDWLIKHNPEVNWDKGTIWFVRCPKKCKIQHQDILFKSRARRITPMKETDKRHQEIGNEPNPINSEDLPKYI